MSLVLKSHCKVNLLLNILGRREDGFHELETIMQPVPLCDELQLERTEKGLELSCNDSRLPMDASNLVHRAATAFLSKAKVEGVRIHLHKNLPLAAGIGAGSSNAAFTLRGLNELFESPLNAEALQELAAGLGSDVPFFLQDGPVLATGRGEVVQPVENFPALAGKGLLLIHPGFGVSTPWAYQALAELPNGYGEAGRMIGLQQALNAGELTGFYNSLEVPVFQKHRVLPLLKAFLLKEGALVALMSGSGSATFALTKDRPSAEALRAKYHEQFGQAGWSATISL